MMIIYGPAALKREPLRDNYSLVMIILWSYLMIYNEVNDDDDDDEDEDHDGG